MADIECKFYDGVKPIAEAAILEVQPGAYIIHIDGQAPRRFKFNTVNKVELVNGRLHIDIQDEKHRLANQLVVVSDVSRSAEIQKPYHDAKVGFLAALIFYFNGLSTGRRLLVLLAMVPAALFIFRLSFMNMYLLVPVSTERHLGDKVFRQVTEQSWGKICNNKTITSSLNKIAADLKIDGDEHDYRVSIIDSPIVNAFALPGGRILFFRGLLEKSESIEEVAGVMAHEMTHIEKSHGLQMMNKLLGITFLFNVMVGGDVAGEFETAETLGEITNLVVFLSYSRSHEEEADLAGVERLHDNKISARGLIDIFQTLDGQENLSILDVLREEVDKGNSKEKKENEAIKKVEDAEEAEDENPLWQNALDLVRTHPTFNQRVEYLRKVQSEETFTARRLKPGKKAWKKLRGKCT